MALLDRNEDDGLAAAEALGGGDNARFFAVDVTDTESIATAVAGIVEWVGTTGKPLGGVVPAAGVGFPGLLLDRKLQPLSLESFDFVLNINLRGTVDLVRQVVPYMAGAPGKDGQPVGAADGPDGERGVIIMVASAAAFEGQMGQVAYSASKGAVASMTLPMARDLSRHGIRVVTIAPSMFDTSMTSAMTDKVRESLLKSMEFPRRPGKPAEFAVLARQAIENPMLNGVVIRLDGASRMPSRL